MLRHHKKTLKVPGLNKYFNLSKFYNHKKPDDVLYKKAVSIVPGQKNIFQNISNTGLLHISMV